MTPVAAPRPPELQLEGSIIRTTWGTFGRVIEVQGPFQPDPDVEWWLDRPDTGGWTIVYEDLREGSRRGTKGWINEVFVEGGRIYASPWRDEIWVEKPAEMQQLALF